MFELGKMAYESVSIDGRDKWESLSKINQWYWACIEKAIREDERDKCLGKVDNATVQAAGGALSARSHGTTG